MNNYISKYAKYDTAYHRTDPFKYATWGEDNQDESIVLIVASVAGFILSLVALMWFA